MLGGLLQAAVSRSNYDWVVGNGLVLDDASMSLRWFAPSAHSSTRRGYEVGQRVDCSRGCPMRALIPAAISLAIVALYTGSFAAQKSAGPPAGTLIVDGGGATEPIVRRFVEIAGGRRADIVVFATGPSEIRFGDQDVILNPDWPRDHKEWSQYEEYLKTWLRID